MRSTAADTPLLRSLGTRWRNDIVCALAALLVDDHGTCLLIIQLCDMLILLEHHLQNTKWMNHTQSRSHQME